MSEKFSSTKLENMDRAEIIHHISKLSNNAIPRGTTRQEAQTRLQIAIQRRHKAHLRAPISIRKRVFGYHKQRKWTANHRHFSHDLNLIGKVWRDEVFDKKRKYKMRKN